jgi:hypothetical protein
MRNATHSNAMISLQEGENQYLTSQQFLKKLQKLIISLLIVSGNNSIWTQEFKTAFGCDEWNMLLQKIIGSRCRESYFAGCWVWVRNATVGRATLSSLS